jgi:apolipoprotein N-acyltransferase
MLQNSIILGLLRMRPNFRYTLLSVLSGLLLSASWFWNLGFLIFFAWVPLLLLEQKLREENQGPYLRMRLLAFSYLCFFIWNLSVTWWIVYASFGGACMAILANALLMSMVFLLYSNLRSKLNPLYSHWLLIPLWLAWEHGHSIWDLSWTWLNLGNVFAYHTNWVQWYEFTGSSGGTLWVLLVNLFVFKALSHQPLKFFSRPILRIVLCILLPVLISYSVRYSRIPLMLSEKPVNVLIVQPNTDPYNIKFVMEYPQQFSKFLQQVHGKVNSETRYVVLPETFITDNINEDQLNTAEAILWFRDSLINKYPDLKVICGGNTYHFYKHENEVTSTSRLDPSSGLHYDYYNAAIYIDKQNTQVYHKSKLVPGVEKMPFPALFKPLEKLALDMGGTVGSLGLQEERSVFNDQQNGIKIAPVICYESVYSDYLTAYVRKGANLIFIITNDGWWDNTPGYKQHLNYARLRAIENRRQIARCANTGVSCFIDEFGVLSQTTAWWQPALIEQKLYPNTQLTFYSRYGDMISYASVLFSLITLLYNFVVGFRYKALHKRNSVTK